MSSVTYDQHQAPRCVIGPADRTAGLTINWNGVVVSGRSAFTSPQTTFVLTEKGNSGGKTLGDKFLVKQSIARAEITVLVIPFSAKTQLSKSRRVGREIMQRLTSSRFEASTSFRYRNVCVTQIDRCTRCWMWRQLSNPTRLSWSS